MVLVEVKRLGLILAVAQFLGSKPILAESKEFTDAKLEEVAYVMTPTQADPASAISPFSLEMGVGIMQSVLEENKQESEQRVQVPELWLKAGLFYPFSLALNLAQDERSGLSSQAAILQWSFFEQPFWPALCLRFLGGQMTGPDSIEGTSMGGELATSWGFNKFTAFASLALNRYDMKKRFVEQDETKTLRLESAKLSKVGFYYQLVPASLSLAGELSRYENKSSFVGKVVAHL